MKLALLCERVKKLSLTNQEWKVSLISFWEYFALHSWESNLNSFKNTCTIENHWQFLTKFTNLESEPQLDCCYIEFVKPVTFNWLAGLTRLHSEFDYSNLDIAHPRKDHKRKILIQYYGCVFSCWHFSLQWPGLLQIIWELTSIHLNYCKIDASLQTANHCLLWHISSAIFFCWL